MTLKNKIQLCLVLLMLPLKFSFGQEQQDLEKTIRQKFESWCNAFPWEEIYIHTDRSRFIAGEELWFKIYLLDRETNDLSFTASLAYVELLNSWNHPVMQKRILLENGTGPGQISLPDTLSTGVYTLRAYTNRMKNFLPGNCFMKKLAIYNAFNDKISEPVTQAIVKGKPVNERSDVNLEADTHNKDLIVIKITADENLRSANNNLSYIIIQTRGKLNFVSKVILTGAVTTVSLPEALLKPGVNQVTLLDAGGKMLTEKFLFKAPEEVQPLIISTCDSCGLRQKVQVKLDDAGPKHDDKVSNLSISVALKDDDTFPGINDYMVFGTEFGILPDKIRNCKPGNLTPEIADAFLSTAVSSWIDWNMIMTGTVPQLNYLPENEVHYIAGKLVSKDNSSSGSSGCLFLSMPGKNPIFRYSRTGKDGRFNFAVPISTDIQDLIIQPEIVDENSVIRIEPSFSERYVPLSGHNDTSGITVPSYISKWSVNYQVGKIYESTSLGPTGAGVKLPASKRFYGKPDLSVKLSDYIALPVMQEVFFELIPGVILKKKKSVYSMSVADPVDNRIYDKPPVMFIDGVVVNDPSVIAGLDPDRIDKIDAVKSLYMVGDYMFFGIVSVISKAGDFSSVTLPDYAVRIKYRVTEPVRTFRSPDYSSGELQKSRIPDFRNTVFWDPAMRRIDGSEFWSSDVPGEYVIDIEGVTSGGKLVSLRKIINVK